MNVVDLYHELNKHLLTDDRPSDYLEEIYSNQLFQEHPFCMLHRLKLTEQNKAHHPEGNVWNHTLLVIDEAAKVKAKSKNSKAFMWAALLHDIGKPDTSQVRKGKMTSYDHDKVGEVLTKKFLYCFTEESDFITDVCGLVRYHMQILFVAKNHSLADVKGMKAHTDIAEIALLGLCDRLGRTKIDRLEETKNIELFLKGCK